jgi:hypothetical protein
VFRPLCPIARVCVHHRVVTYSGHFLFRYSHGTFFCNVLNALRRLRPLTGVCSLCISTPAWLHLPDISVFAIHMGPSSVTFSTRFLVSAHSRVCVPMSLNPRVVTSYGHFHLRFCNTFLLTLLYSLQHSLLLMLSLSLLRRSFSLYQKITPYIRFRDW